MASLMVLMAAVLWARLTASVCSDRPNKQDEACSVSRERRVASVGRVARWYVGDVVKRRLERRDGTLQTSYDSITATGKEVNLFSEGSARSKETIVRTC